MVNLYIILRNILTLRHFEFYLDPYKVDLENVLCRGLMRKSTANAKGMRLLLCIADVTASIA